MVTRSKARKNNPQNKRKRSENEGSETVGGERRTNEPSPLNVGIVVKTVLGFLDAESIKSARQVNKLWSAEGAKILLTECFVKIPSDLQSAKSSTTKKKAMKKFNNFLSHRSRHVSMISNITVTNVADVKLWKSLGVLGSQVNAVKLTKIDDNGEILKNLLELLPNFKYLNLENKSQRLKGLDIISFLTPAMSKLEKDGNSLIISGIHLYAGNVEEFEKIEEFSECSSIKFEELEYGIPYIRRVSIAQFEARKAVILSKLLSTSQNTLHKLVIIGPDLYLPLVHFPCMTGLTTFGLAFGRMNRSLLPQCKFSLGFQFSEKFPNVDHVELDNFSASLFENFGTAPAVKFLSFGESARDLSFYPLFQHFPNIEGVNLFLLKDKNVALASIFQHGKNIKELGIYVYVPDSKAVVPSLDSLLTGFSPDTVDMMKKEGKRGIADHRINPSILDVKGLKFLLINLTGNGKRFLPERTLAIAGQQAFRMMPKDSKICIRVEDTAAAIKRARIVLDEVSKLPNVTVEFVERNN